MYLGEIIIKNSGPIEDFHFAPEFAPDGGPRPIVLVGANGGGKTSILSIVADAMVEVAATHFIDVAPVQGAGHRFFRLIGSTTIRMGSTFELTLVKFNDQAGDRRVIGKAGTLPPALVANLSGSYPEVAPLQDNSATKITSAGDNVESVFRGGVYAFFQGGRTETPHWAVHETPDSAGNFAPSIAGSLGKPIIVGKTFEQLKPWLVDLILDASIDAGRLLQIPDHATMMVHALQAYNQIVPLQNLNSVIQIILGVETAHFVRTGRLAQNRKIAIASGLIPTFGTLGFERR